MSVTLPGREAVIDRLRAAVARVGEGPSESLLIEGGPGPPRAPRSGGTCRTRFDVRTLEVRTP